MEIGPGLGTLTQALLQAGAIVHAVYSGHQYAQQLDSSGGQGYLRDIQIAQDPPGEVYKGW